MDFWCEAYTIELCVNYTCISEELQLKSITDKLTRGELYYGITTLIIE